MRSGRTLLRSCGLGGALLALAACGNGNGPEDPLIRRDYLPLGENANLVELRASQAFPSSSTLHASASGVRFAAAVDPQPSDTQITILAVGPNDGDFRLRVESLVPRVFVDETFVRPLHTVPRGIAGDLALANNGVVFTYASPAYTGAIYTAYGIWSRSAGDELVGGTLAFGIETPATLLPVSGMAVYTGVASGTFLQASTLQQFASDLTSTIDFGPARSVTLVTTNSVRAPVGVLDQSFADPSLNVTGTLLMVSGTNAFIGGIRNGYGMTGTGTGRFYGPRAEEMGGVFLLTDPLVNRTQAGGFAARCAPTAGTCP
jgi:hypothetical protein